LCAEDKNLMAELFLSFSQTHNSPKLKTSRVFAGSSIETDIFRASSHYPAKFGLLRRRLWQKTPFKLFILKTRVYCVFIAI